MRTFLAVYNTRLGCMSKMFAGEYFRESQSNLPRKCLAIRYLYKKFIPGLIIFIRCAWSASCCNQDLTLCSGSAGVRSWRPDHDMPGTLTGCSNNKSS